MLINFYIEYKDIVKEYGEPTWAKLPFPPRDTMNMHWSVSEFFYIPQWHLLKQKIMHHIDVLDYIQINGKYTVLDINAASSYNNKILPYELQYSPNAVKKQKLINQFINPCTKIKP